ncbi:YqgE/AlgH family protein [Inmirania thermothiophila]|uniref:UPF0301 protein EDC57_0415 n=1 Tax=Inmirania thermothiophila TaxID=1750597 RepID=A0A3N1YAV3_9GAMM|nr:YqgE/AlgH family protein [Inmirania thermothiophila]ROR34517.1 putative transcriptional regulator [Inmirania thermothiophila]
MDGPSYLTGQFLIAMPALADPNFARTVTYVCEHNADGAMGIVVNRPLELTLGELLDHLEIPCTDAALRARPVFYGGPVQRERGFVLHRPAGEWEASLRIGDDLGLTTSRDILAALAEGRGPEQALVALGYAGWAAGQLEQEMAANAWLSAPGDRGILFDLAPERRWEAAAALVGVDLNNLSGEVGHA